MKEHKIKLTARKVKDGLYEVKGVMFTAKSKLEAILKYARVKT